jgi:hypothetical protein
MIRSISEIGNLWPLCTNCGHIAQSHSFVGCDARIKNQCPTCGIWGHDVVCSCREYVGMTRAEWFALLTPEEIAKYNYTLEER